MRAYLIVTSLVFAALVAVHVARAAVEGRHVLADPFFVGSTLAAAGLCGWALVLLARRR